MSNDLGLDPSDLEIDDALPGAAEEAILLAQVDAGRDPGAGSSSSEQPSGNAPGISVIAPDRDARIYLSAPASLEEIRLDGNDLLLIQPDGSQIRITGGALTVPTFIIGDIEVPQEVLIAALAANGFDVAAGPGGALSLSPQAPAGSGGELEPSSDATLVGDVRGVLGLLGDSAEAEDQSFEEGSDVPAAQDATITPTRTNNAPVLSGAVTGAAVEDGVSVSLSALANASDVDAATVLAVVDLPATLPAGVSYDAATQRFTLDPAHAAYQSLAAGATTTVTVNYGVSDGIATTPASVSWTVTGTNDAPVVTGAVTGTAVEDGVSVSLSALANASDIDAGAVLSVVDLPATLPAGVNYDAATQRFTLDPAHAAYQSLAAGATTTVTVTYGVSDGIATTPASVSWTVTGTNNAPVVSGAVTGAAVEDGASVSLSALANASDVDAATVLAVVDLPATLPAGVSYDAATQRFTLDPAHAAYQSLAAGSSTTVTVAYGVSDGTATTPASVSWTVIGTNDAPVVSGAVTGTAIEDGSSVSLSALAKAADVDVGAILSVVDLPATLPAGVSYDAATQRFTLDPAHAAYQSLAAGATTTVTVTYGVSDGIATTPASVSWTVTGTNDAPVVSGAVTGTAIEDGSSVSLDALANASDVDAGAVLTVVDLPATLPAGVSYDAATMRFTLDPSVAAYQSLAAGATTTVTVAYGVSDGLATTPASVSWTVTGTNDAPVISGATGQNVAENAAGALVGTFTVTDVDTATGLTFRVLDGATVDARFTVLAASGTTFGQPGLYEIRLAPGQSLDFEVENADGDPTIVRTIEVNDGQSANNLATAAFTLTVTDVPEGALAVDDTGSTLEDTAVTFTVAQLIANDDGQGRPLTITGVSNAVNGTVSFADGVITFTPAANFFGQASFTYTLDNGAATGTATVSIDVAPVNDAPVVSGAVTGTAVEDGSSVSLDALANASDVDAATVLAVVDLPATLPAGVSYDAATQRFTLDPAHAAYQSLAAGSSTTVTVAYGVSDGTATTPASVSWTVTGTNDAPVVSGAVTGAAIEDGSSVSLDALANASDVDAATVLAVVDLPATLPAGVSYDAATQRFTLDPAHAAYQSLAAGSSTTVTVAYGVSDGTATTPASVSWTVTGTNDAPVVSGAVTGAAVEDGVSVSLSALANATDVDAGAVLSVVDLPATLPAGVNYDAATQRFTLDPSAAAYQSLAAGAVTTVTITYGVSDGLAITPASVSWTVTGTNDAPVVTGAVTGTAVEDGVSVSLSALANASDVDTGAVLSVVDLPPTLPAGVSYDAATQRFTLDPSVAAYQSLAAGATTTVTVAYGVSDGLSTTPASVSWTVTGTNDAPVVSGAVTGTAIEDGSSVSLDALANASDVDAGAILSVVELPPTLPAGVSYDAATQRFTLDPAHAAYQSLAAGATTTVTVAYGVSDGTATTPASVSWTVTGTNDAPVISGATGQNVAENAAGALVGTFTVTDVDTATGLTFRVLDGATVDARFTVVAASGTTFGQPGLYEIRLAPGQSLDFEAENADGDPTISRTIEVSDGAGVNNLATAAFTLTVTDVPEGALAVDDTGSTLEDTAVTFTVAQLTANDVNTAGAGPLMITGVSGAVNGTATFAGGIITFTPEANFSGIASFDYTLDNGAGTDTGTVTIDVAPVAAPAVLSLPGAVAAAPVQVTGVTTSEAPAIAALSGGGHVVVWYNANNLHYATYTADGVPGASGVLSGGPYYDRGHSVIGLADNGFAIIGNTNDSRPASIHVFASAGGTATVTQIATGNFRDSAMTRLENGDIAFAIGYGGSNPDIRIGVITPGASAPSALVNALANQAGRQEAPDIAALPGGGFVVAWTTYTAIEVQRYSTNGVREGAVTTSLPVAADILSFAPSIAVLADGSYVVAFYSSGLDRDVFQLRYGADGQPLGQPAGMPVRVNTSTPSDQTEPEVVALPDGGYVIVWNSENSAARGIFGQRFNANGEPVGAEFQVVGGTAYLGSLFVDGAATLTSDGDLLVAYQSSTNSGTISYARVEIAALGLEDKGPISLPLSVTIEPGDMILSITVTGVPSGAILSDGVRSATSTGAAIDLAGWTLSTLTFTPPANASGTFTLTLSVTTSDTATLSSGSVTDTATVTRSFEVTVIAVNDAPVISGAAGQSVAENEAGALVGIFTVSDVDTASGLTFRVLNGASVDARFVVVPASGTTAGAPGVYEIRLVSGTSLDFEAENADGNPTITRTIEVNDGAGANNIVTATFTVTVTDVAEGPRAVGDSSTTLEDTAVTFTVAQLTGNDVNPVGAGPLTIPGVSNPVNGTVSFAGGIVTFTPAANFSGQASFTYTLDNGAGTDIATVAIDVAPVADGAVVTVGPDLAADPLALTGDLVANTTTAGAQRYGSVSALASGGYVIAWASDGQDGSNWGIYAQRFAADGTAVGSETLVNMTTNDAQHYPATAGLDDGGYVVTWTSLGTLGGGWEIYARRYDAEGNALSGETLVNTFIATDQIYPAVAAIAGGYIVTWSSFNQVAGTNSDIYAQRFFNDGSRDGSETRVNTFLTGSQAASAVAGLDEGYVVTWQSEGQDGSERGIYAQRYNGAGAAVGGEFQVNSTTDGEQFRPSVAGLAGGGFVVTWQSDAAGSLNVYMQRYDAAGERVGSETRVNTYTTGNQTGPTVTASAEGYVVSWTSFGQDGSLGGTFAQRFAVDGTPIGGEFRLNATTIGSQIFDTQTGGTGIAVTADGKLVAIWETPSADIGTRLFQLPTVINGDAGTAIAIAPVTVTLTDASETVSSVALSGLPSGFVLTDGTRSATSTGGAIDLAGWTLASLAVTPPITASGTFTLTLSITTNDTATVSSGTVTDTATTTASFDVAVIAYNAPPQFVSPSTSVSISEDTAVASGIVSFSDDNGAGTFAGWSFQGTSTTGGASLPALDADDIFNTTGSTSSTIDWSFSASPTVFQYLDAGQSITYTYRLEVSDGVNPPVYHTVSIRVEGAYDAPVAMNALADSILAVPDGWDLLGYNGHIYTGGTAANANSALTAAAALIPSKSYLATVTSAVENATVYGILNVPVWHAYLGGSDTAVEGVWRWLAGPEAGQIFWGPGAAAGSFTDWNAGEPNNFGGNEDFISIVGPADGNDVTKGGWADVGAVRIVGQDIYFIAEAGQPGELFADLRAGEASQFSSALLTANDLGNPVVQSVSATSALGNQVSFDGGSGLVTINSAGMSLAGRAVGDLISDSFTYTLADGSVATATVQLRVTTLTPATYNDALAATTITYNLGAGNNATTAGAVNLTGGGFVYRKSNDPDVTNATTSPSITIAAQTTDGEFDYYRFTITAANTTVRFDIDNTYLDTVFMLYGSDGTTPLNFNDDGPGYDRGDLRATGSYLQTTLGVGTYYLRVGQFEGPTWVNQKPFIMNGGLYELQVSFMTPGDPIVLDLDGDGVDLSATTVFDLDADGAPDMIGWAGAADGILVMDLDGSGAIENGSELFSEVFGGVSYADSLAALAALDDNGDGVIDARDRAYNDILIWQDANSDGVSQAGELRTLADRGIASIDLNAAAAQRSVNGNTVFAEGVFTRTDGSTGTYAGVAFGPAGAETESEEQARQAASGAGPAIILFAASVQEVAAGLEAVAVTGVPQHGKIVVTNDFTVIYTPTPGFEGVEQVRLELSFADGTVTGQTIDLAVGNATGASAGDDPAATSAPVTVTARGNTGDNGGNDLFGSEGDDLLLGLGGDDYLFGGRGDDHLDGGAGADILISGPGRDTLSGGAGADRFVFDVAALADAGVGIRDLIVDYRFDEGDIIDLSALLGSSTVNGGNASAYVRLNGDVLEIDIDGAGGASGFVEIAEFSIVPAMHALRILVGDDPSATLVV